ncbi:MAG: hypothetical protein OER86_11905, partial [Phycisphaerae bacterium]|nr:hypothetical protein [Phycisphaerae bacterium]
RYRVARLVHDPPIELIGMSRQQLLDALPAETKPAAKKNRTRPGWTPQVTAWRKKLDANDPGVGKWSAVDHDDSKWKTMSLPGFFEGRGLPDHDGTVWYRKEIDLPKSLSGKNLTLELGPIDDMDMTWFNGVQVGGFETPGYWLAPRKYDVPASLARAGRNVIAVRVIDHGWGGGFGGRAEQMKLSGAGRTFSLAGAWRYRPGVHLKTVGLGPLTNPPGAPLLVPKAAPSAPPPVAAWLRPLKRPGQPVAPFDNGFALGDNQTLVLLGGTNAFECGRTGWLETLTTIAFRQRRVRFRNMAWQADTVFQQQRPRNFFSASKPGYGERDGRPPVSAGVILFWMGQAEALGGAEQRRNFAGAYRRQVDRLLDYTGRIVLVTPVPFEDPLAIGFDLATRNRDLAAVTRTIEAIGREKKLAVVNLSQAWRWGGTGPWTRDGVQLSEVGQRQVAEAIAGELGFANRIRSAAYRPDQVEALRQLVRHKSDLWLAYWRPTNWAFLYGNRQSQPSSRDHRNRAVRWFPDEVNQTLAQLEAAEQAIFQFVRKQETQP